MPQGLEENELKILSWNVYNLFDAVDNGTEYPEYDPSGGLWNSGLYRERLKNTAEVISKACPPEGPDIICLQEIENKRVAEDLASSWLENYSYRYVFCADKEEAAVTTGILSRYPIAEIRSHAVFHRDFPDLRPVTEVMIEAGGETIILFNCHFKSRLGGEEYTEPARIAAASAVNSRCIEIFEDNPEAVIVIAGDLNENIDEYQRQEMRFQTALLPAGLEKYSAVNGSLFFTGDASGSISGRSPVFYSPWPALPGKGSYLYRDIWNTLDHFFLSSAFADGKGIEFSGFSLIDRDEFRDKNGAMSKWNSRTMRGYSDHFPIMLSLSFED